MSFDSKWRRLLEVSLSTFLSSPFEVLQTLTYIPLAKEKEVVYKLWSHGFTLVEYARKHNIREGSFLLQLKNGIKKNEILITEAEFQTDIFNISEISEDIKSFHIIVKEGFCKLIGDYQGLDNFRDKYSIDFDIIPYQHVYCLCFDGRVYEYIKAFC